MFKNTTDVCNNESGFIRNCLFKGLRVDGRQLDECRDIEVILNRQENSSIAEVQLSGTRVICVVSADIVSPYPDRPTEGILQITCGLSCYAEQSSVYYENDLRRFLEKSIRESDAIDLESLCIISGEKVWRIVCDVQVIDCSSGNIIDSSLFAIMSGLRAFRKPDVSVVSIGVEEFSGRNKVQIIIHEATEREPLPLALHHTPLSATIGLFKLEPIDFDDSNATISKSSNLISLKKSSSIIALVCDPTYEEERAMDSYITYSMTAHRELCSIIKPGGIALTVEMITKAANLCFERTQELHQALQAALNELEESVMKDRIILLEQLRKYRSQISVEHSALVNTPVLDDKVYKGIDRNDPILSWGHLHKPAMLPS